MTLRPNEPDWWYAAEPNSLVRLLRPAGAVYGWIAERRLRQARPYACELPVVCIGNFTAGGTGKTPLVRHLARQLTRRGEHPAVLTRGYGGREPGPRRVDATRDTAADVGDEALLLARDAPVIVARDRRAGAKAIAAMAGGASAVIMDDGLQNPSLVKDLTIAVLDGKRGLGNGEIIPAGPLRAPLDIQLQRTDAIVVNQGFDAVGEAQSQWIDWLKRRFDGPLLLADVQVSGDVAWITGARIVAFAGIGAPHRFFTLLEGLGAELVESVALPDHHPFSERDAARLLAAARRADAALVTTDKDWVRLQGAGGLRSELRGLARPVAVDLRFDDREARRLESLIDTALSSARRARPPGVA